jgi:hypothetical protein
MIMPKNVVCKKCNNLVNDWCEKVIDSPDPDMVRDCRHFWEKTNADRIRAMSDEELAKLLLDGCRGSKCEEQPQNDFGSVNCFDCRMKWLKQPAEAPKEEVQ